MRTADIRIRHLRGIFRFALCCALIAALNDCTTSGGSQTASGNTSTGRVSAAAVMAPILSLTAGPSSISSGDASALSWSSTNATSCTASGGWSGSEPTSGSASTGALSATTTYTLSCSGSGGSASQSVTVNVTIPVAAGGASCSATSGGLTLQAKAIRSSGISPVLMFFDATGTTSTAVSGGHSAFQDVSYSWDFGDTGVSGSGTWAYGSNTGHNSKNTATGAVAAHLYVAGADTTYPVTVTAYDGTSSASCQLGVSAYAASGANGFPASATTCVAASSVPVAGSGGCPSGANVIRQSDIGTTLSSAFGSGRRVLFHCGDTFTGTYTIGANVSKASIGAYGGCENSSSSRPIFQNSGGDTITFTPNNPTDIRIADIDFEDGTHSAQAIGNGGGLGETQITLYNLECNGMNACYYMNQATQSGIVASVATGMHSIIGTYWNYAANNCLNGSSAANCGGTPGYHNVAYNAVMGNSFDGAGAANPGSGIETLRISACRYCVIANNTVKNANNVAAVLKFNSANTYNSQPTWIGQYSEYIQIADNLFTGNSGGWSVEVASENSAYDERERFIVIERNYFLGTLKSKVLDAAVNSTVRNNVFYFAPTNTGDYGIQIAGRGVDPTPVAVEVYNNTCYARVTMSSCVGFAAGDGASGKPGANSWAYNNLFYNNGTSSPAVINNGSGNTVSNNTANSAANPLLINASGSFGLISDFQPTQAYSSGADVPVWYDALGVAWTPTWSLGALKP